MSTTATPPRRSPFIAPARGPSPRRAPVPQVIGAGLLAAAASIVAWLIVQPAHPRPRRGRVPGRPVPRGRLRRVRQQLVRRPRHPRLQPRVLARRRARRPARGRRARRARVNGLLRGARRAALAPGPAAAACVAFGLAASADLWIGRLTFVLGVTLALRRGARRDPRALVARRSARRPVRGRQPGRRRVPRPLRARLRLRRARAAAPGRRAGRPGARHGLGGDAPFPRRRPRALPGDLVRRGAHGRARVPRAHAIERARAAGRRRALRARRRRVAARPEPDGQQRRSPRRPVRVAAAHRRGRLAARRRRRAPLIALALAGIGLAVWIAWGPVRRWPR